MTTGLQLLKADMPLLSIASNHRLLHALVLHNVYALNLTTSHRFGDVVGELRFVVA